MPLTKDDQLNSATERADYYLQLGWVVELKFINRDSRVLSSADDSADVTTCQQCQCR